MDIASTVLKYLMEKSTPFDVVLMLVLWWGYRLLMKKEEAISAIDKALDKMTEQMALNRETQTKSITLLETLVYGKRNQ